MKLSKLMTCGLAAFALTAAGVRAQTISPTGTWDATTFTNSYASGDLILGFFSQTGSNDVLFDIGTLSSYQTPNVTPNTIYTVTGFDTPADVTGSASTTGPLGATEGGVGPFGANVLWTVAGGIGSSGELALSVAAGNNLTNNTTYTTLAANLDSFGGELAGNIGSGNSNYDAILSDKPFYNNLGSSAGQTWTGGPQGPVSDSVTTGTSSLVLWDLNNGTQSGAAKELGTFMFNSTTDVLTFTAIPEPSTYAAILGLLTVGFVMVRRRFGSSGLITSA